MIFSTADFGPQNPQIAVPQPVTGPQGPYLVVPQPLIGLQGPYLNCRNSRREVGRTAREAVAGAVTGVAAAVHPNNSGHLAGPSVHRAQEAKILFGRNPSL